MTTPTLIDLLSECAVEIENLSDSNNVVAKRARAAMAELKGNGFDINDAWNAGYKAGNDAAKRMTNDLIEILARELE